MKKLFLALMIIFLLAACLPSEEPQLDASALYTIAAQTVAAQFTQAALLTPSATVTNTPEPTLPPTATLPPSPTSPPPTPTWQVLPAGKVTAPILTYLRIAGSKEDDANYKWNSDYVIPPDKFEQQMKLLKDNGYTTITVSYLAEVIRKGGSMPPRPVVITFDGGAKGIYTLAYPIMKSLGFVGTVYLIASQIDGSWMMTSEQIKELAAAGWEIGSKGMTDVDPTTDYSVLSDEIAGSKQRIKERIGVEPMSFSYPYGKIDGMIGPRVVEWGYTSAVGVFKSNDHTANSLFYLERWEVRKKMDLEDFIKFLPWAPEVMPPTATPTLDPSAQPTPMQAAPTAAAQ